MFYHQRTSIPDSPRELRTAYDDELARIVREVDGEAVGKTTSVDRDEIETLLEGGSPDLSLTGAAEIASLAEGAPDAETIVVEACEHLLLGMSMAVLDVESLASHLDLDLEPKEIQQKIERRAPMSFDEYVHLQFAIVDRTT